MIDLARRIYFYKDEQGIIQKYSYCCICGVGPFKQSEKNISFISTGSKSDICYCEKCHKNLGIKNVGASIDDIPSYLKPSQVLDFKKPIVEEKKVFKDIEKSAPVITEEFPEEIPEDISEDPPLIDYPGTSEEIPEEIPEDPLLSDDPRILEEIEVIPAEVPEEPTDEPEIQVVTEVVPEVVTEEIKEPEVPDEVTIAPALAEPVSITEPEINILEVPAVAESLIIEEPEINAVNPTLIVEPEIPRDVFKEEIKKPVKLEPDIFVYMGQYMDGSFKVDITRNVQLEIKKINQGIYPDVKNLPVELIYYRKFKDWKRALSEKDKIQQMNSDRKEELSKEFIKNFFKSLNI